MSWLKRRRPAKKFSHKDTRRLEQCLVRWDQPIRDWLKTRREQLIGEMTVAEYRECIAKGWLKP